MTETERLAACQALVRRADGQGPAINETVYRAGRSICAGEDLSTDRIRRLGLLRELYEDEPDVLEFLGGIRRAAVSISLTRRLVDLDLTLRAKILVVSDLVLVDAAERLDIEVRNKVDRACLTHDEVKAFELLDTPDFLRVLRAPARATLTHDEETRADRLVEESLDTVEGLLEQASIDVQRNLRNHVDVDQLAETHQTDRARSVALYGVAMGAMVLGRLDRSTQDDKRVMTQQALTPVGVARDTLEVAGGAASTPAGGLSRENGIPLALDGSPSVGANFAQGNSTSAGLEASQGLVAQRIFRSSGSSDPRTEHALADGFTEEELGGAVFPGQHSTCGCGWVIEWRTP